MSLEQIFNIAGSGMSAQSIQLNTIASNLANADSVGSSPDSKDPKNGVFRARQPVFAATLLDTINGFSDEHSMGVQVEGIIESSAPLEREYQPNHPKADSNGYIYRTNVKTIEQMTNMIAASRSYQANVDISEVAKQLCLKTLSLGS